MSLDRTLTDQEAEISDLVGHILNEHPSMSRSQAAKLALAALPCPQSDFVSWLSGGELLLVDGQVLVTKYLTDANHPLTRE